MPRRSLLTLLLCAGLLAACSSAREQEDDGMPRPAQERTTLRVDNRGFLDMTVYVLDGAQRVRLGVANGNRTTDLTIPPHLVRGAAPLRFYCDPIGGSETPVTEELVVRPGDEVTLTIMGG